LTDLDEFQAGTDEGYEQGVGMRYLLGGYLKRGECGVGVWKGAFIANFGFELKLSKVVQAGQAGDEIVLYMLAFAELVMLDVSNNKILVGETGWDLKECVNVPNTQVCIRLGSNRRRISGKCNSG
jgi:hypothetical protein